MQTVNTGSFNRDYLAVLISTRSIIDVMPYDKISELPDSVKDNLPKHGQTIYKEAYNSAWDEYDDKSDRRGDASREETSHRVAWSAVKNKYKKEGDKWVEKKN